MEYSPRDIERKWQDWWKANNTYRVSNHSDKPKYYVLDMFPYPSGAGLHVGHPLGYIASDILTRFKRLQGYNVLHPMGFDAFGLPAEQYAIENGIHPAVSTEENIRRYRAQLDNLALSFDWSREVRTCDPAYYRWTQWIFLRMFNSWYDTSADKARPIEELTAIFSEKGNEGLSAATHQEEIFTADQWNRMSATEQAEALMNYRLMYRKTGYVNWCEALGTVLANDEVVNGVSERGGHPVEIKPMLQWSMRITAYAERLLNGLDAVDFPEALKIMQRNWIGRSEGAQVFFDIADFPEKLEIYTTRPDTMFGATFMVLAPEHDFVQHITTESQRAEINRYLDWVKSRTELDRMSEKVVSGAFTGAYAVHPFTGEPIPIYIAEYVLKGYGAGAIMGVPADDERDQRFAEKFGLPIVPVVDRSAFPDAEIEDKVGTMVNSGFLNGLSVLQAIERMCRELETKGIGRKKVHYKLRDANYSRQRYWGEPFPIVYDEAGTAHALPESELPLELPTVQDFKPGGGKGPLAKLTEWTQTPAGRRDTDTMPGFAGSSWYFLRYMDPNNQEAFASQEAIEYWRDVDFYIGGAEHAVGHLLYSRMWHKFLFDYGLTPTEEPYRKLVNQGMIQGKSKFVHRAVESFYEAFLFNLLREHGLSITQEPTEAGADMKIEDPEVYIEVKTRFGQKFSQKDADFVVDAAQSYAKYLFITNDFIAYYANDPAEIFQAVNGFIQSEEAVQILDVPESYPLFVCGNLASEYGSASLHVDVSLVNSDNELDIEGFQRWRSDFRNARFLLSEGKYYCTEEVEKMSKSKYNVVNPDDMVAQYGADCFRMYEMFLGPIEVSKPWDTKGITGVYGFLRKYWGLFFNEQGEWDLSDDVATREELKALHTCIKKVTDDIERFSMNTCVSHFMICTNELRRLNCNKRAVLEPLNTLLTPFAPHIAEEIHHRLGHETSVCDAVWPSLNEEYLKSDTIKYPVQINGKLRGELEIAVGVSNADIESMVMAQEFVQRNLAGAPVKKFIVVPNRIINIVI